MAWPVVVGDGVVETVRCACWTGDCDYGAVVAVDGEN